MISKGTTHDNGGRLARYMVNGKHGERAELHELRGFASPDIVEAFRSVHVMAEATRCQQPFFHVQVRNPEGDRLNAEQWQYTADRIERMLGLADQPRAIAFHIDENTGERHMHVAWSRIDAETLTAKKLPFFKERLKKISRELELHFDLTLVPNERDSSIKYAPTRAEEEQSRRLGLDVHEIRQAIRDCFERSDSGRSFEAALASENLILAKGERRDFVVVDQSGGMYALGKRILGVSAADMRARLGDLDRDHLLTVEQAQERAAPAPEAGREKQEPVWDRDSDHVKWLDAVVQAVIEKEKSDRQFVEPTRAEMELFEIERQAFRDLESVGLLRENLPEAEPPGGLKAVEREIWEASSRAKTSKAFEEALIDQRLAFAVVTKEEADQSYREASFAKTIGRCAPRYNPGEVVVVREPGLEFRDEQGGILEGGRIHKIDPVMADRFLMKLDIEKESLPGIGSTKAALDQRAQIRAKAWEALRMERATAVHSSADMSGNHRFLTELVAHGEGLCQIGLSTATEFAGAVIEAIGNFFSPTELTAERVEAAISAREARSLAAVRERSDALFELSRESRAEQKAEEERQREYYKQGLDDRER